MYVYIPCRSHKTFKEVITLCLELLHNIENIEKEEMLTSLFLSVCVSVSRDVHMSSGVWKDPKSQIHLELELQAVVSHLMQMLGLELGSFATIMHALNFWAIFPIPTLYEVSIVLIPK